MARLLYNNYLKPYARKLRSNLTDAELLLWSRIRRRQILDIQFYRQKSIGNFIVDFFAPKVRLVIEIDGSQHLEELHIEQDKNRDIYLKGLGLHILRFDNLQVLQSIDSVLEAIYNVIQVQKSPLAPL
jgi:very-short-patch-repair endonuclease